MRTALLEAGRRSRAVFERRRERAMLVHQRKRLTAGASETNGAGAKVAGTVAERGAARLGAEWARMDASELLEHFRTRATPCFLPGFDETTDVQARVQRELFRSETAELLEQASDVVDRHRWPLLGFGVREFGAEVDWLRDPLSGTRWPLEYHAELGIFRGDGSDLRVLWELNRFAHLITLGRAYALTSDARMAEEFFTQLESWRAQNPLGFGANWHCAMEVALRAMNLLAAFRLFRRAPEMSVARLAMLLAMFDEHGAHIRRNLEFSHIATGNHYLSDVAGLLWLGVSLPELDAADEWREFGLRELLREMDKQVLPDGADCESSTGYHRLVLELFLYSFILCRANAIEIPERYWHRLRTMFDYMRAYIRPDGHAPLIGDTDSGQVLPVKRRAADEHAYVLAIGAALFDEASFRIADDTPEELFWMMGAEGVEKFSKLKHEAAAAPSSAAFRDAGVYVMREGDLYMLFNATGAGLGGRGSHGHNDALGVEVAACGVSFISDAGTYVYTADFDERHLFRSTAYHSTVEIDGAEQNTTDREMPFVIGNEAQPRLVHWETGAERDLAIAEHDGYRRLPHALTHRRAVRFEKRGRYWLIEDAFRGEAAEHTFRFRFHAAPDMDVRVRADVSVEVCAKMTPATRLLIAPLDQSAQQTLSLEPRWSSRDYGAKTESVAACWTLNARAPLAVRWALVPVCGSDDEDKRVSLIERLKIEARG